MKSVVTGGAGFIGSHLAEALADIGHEVVVIDDLSGGKHRKRYLEAKGIHLEELDIREERTTAFIEALRPDYIFHLAAQPSVPASVTDPSRDADVNIIGSIRVLEGAARSGSRFIFATSGGCIYGDQVAFPIPEEAQGVPDSPYGASKKAMGSYLHYYSRNFGMPYVNLALANVYGPRQDPTGESGVVAIFSSRLLQGQQCVIFGDGKQTRDYVYVSDVVDAFLAACAAGDSELINVGTGREIPLISLYEAMVAELSMEHMEPVFAQPRKGDLFRSALEVSKAERVLGWRPKVDIKEGIARTIEYFREETA